MFPTVIGTPRALVVAALAALGGCAAMPQQHDSPLDRPGAPQTVAIVVGAASGAPQPEQIDAGAGAASGAMAGAATGLQLLMLFGPQALIVAPALGAVVAAGALAGAAGGAVAGESAATVAERVKSALTATEATTLRAVLSARTAQAIAEAAAALTPYRSDVIRDPSGSADASPTINRPGLQGYGAVIGMRDPVLRLWPRMGMETRMALNLAAGGSLIDPASGRTIALRGFLVESAPHTAAEWTRDDAALAKREVDRLVRALAERVVETFLLQSGLAIGESSAQVCGVAPIQPLYEWPYTDFGYPRVDTLLPRLEWQSRPREPPSLAPPDSATDFRYDLRVWKVVDGHVDDLVVERFGLSTPEYRFETPLAPATTYGWSVRARYTVDGRARATRWSAIERPVQPWSDVEGALTYGTREGDRVVATNCRAGRLTPCGCLDFLPAASLWRFTTP